jgi:hypothetical protein
MKLPRLERGSYHSDDQLQIFAQSSRSFRLRGLLGSASLGTAYKNADAPQLGGSNLQDASASDSDQPEFHFPGFADHVLVPGWIPN